MWCLGSQTELVRYGDERSDEMLSDEEKAGIARLDRDQLEGLLALIRKAKAMFGTGAMPMSAVEDLVKAVPDEQVRAIVHDLRGGRAQPGGLIEGTSGGPVVRGTGWAERKLESPPGVAICDQMMDVQDALDKRELRERLGGFKQRV
jgi:hypothetical protein